MEELRRDGRNLPDPLDLHKPYVDQVTFDCTCGDTMRRIPEVVDAWFDSGSMPFAQWHYPFENEEIFKHSFPADYIAEGVDQTRGWFYTLHAISSHLFKQPSSRMSSSMSWCWIRPVRKCPSRKETRSTRSRSWTSMGRMPSDGF